MSCDATVFAASLSRYCCTPRAVILTGQSPGPARNLPLQRRKITAPRNPLPVKDAPCPDDGYLDKREMAEYGRIGTDVDVDGDRRISPTRSLAA